MPYIRRHNIIEPIIGKHLFTPTSPYMFFDDKGDFLILSRTSPDGLWTVRQQGSRRGLDRIKPFVLAEKRGGTSKHIYKLRISVDSSQLKTALDLVIPELLSEESPIEIFKVTDVDTYLHFNSRLYEGGQFTLYLKPETNLIQLAAFFYNIEKTFIAAELKSGIPPESDFLISTFISGRCGQLLSSAPMVKGAAFDEYVSGTDSISESTANCFLFHFMRMYFLARFELDNLISSGEHEASKVTRAEKLFADFYRAYYRTDLHHHDLIIRLVVEVLLPLYHLQDKEGNAFTLMKGIPTKEDYPGYGRFVDELLAERIRRSAGAYESVSAETTPTSIATETPSVTTTPISSLRSPARGFFHTGAELAKDFEGSVTDASETFATVTEVEEVAKFNPK